MPNFCDNVAHFRSTPPKGVTGMARAYQLGYAGKPCAWKGARDSVCSAAYRAGVLNARTAKKVGERIAEVAAAMRRPFQGESQ